MSSKIRRVIPLLGNWQMLDGGAMFGNVPKTLWSKWLVPNQYNQVKLACRSLFVGAKLKCPV
jgi:hypothetical protein